MSAKDKAKRWLGKLTRLNPASGRNGNSGKAPHKPLLLLSLLDALENGELASRVFTRTPGLVLRFRCYAAIPVDRWKSRLGFDLPFFHLSNQSFWEAFTSDMRPASSPDDCAVCELDPDFYQLMLDPGFRLKARMVLISKYFQADERIALLESLGLKPTGETFDLAKRELESAVESAKTKGRGARFRIRIPTEYRFVCALTGYRCTSVSGATIVDAAHIDQWSRSANDELDNGLALSKSAHWAFDEGLWSVNSEMRVVVNPSRFTDSGPEMFRLTACAGRHLQFDPMAKLRPSLDLLRKHRLRFGFAG